MNNNTYVVCDLETSIDNDVIGDFGGSPWYSGNRVVQSGWLWDDGKIQVIDYRDDPYTVVIPYETLLIGHNFKFDLQYLWRDKGFSDWFWSNGVKVWDTMVAQYVLTGQQDKFASLNYCSGIYGGTQKIDKVKEMWEAGVRTEDIDPDLLREYLIGDLKNTEIVYKAQVKEAERLGLMPLILSMQEATLCAGHMEYNGLCFDKGVARDAMTPLRDSIVSLEEDIIMALHADDPTLPYIHMNVGSDAQLSAALFGGVLKTRQRDCMYDDDGQVILYKGGKNAGKPKTKWFDIKTECAGMASVPDNAEKTKAGHYQVGEDIIKKVKHPVIPLVLAYRAAKKDLSTYYVGYSNMAWPDELNSMLGTIHHKLNTVGTETGRLSSSTPNLQNVSGKGAIKECFVSRWGKDGSILQGDYSQLEIVYQAWVSGDEAMMQDIREGIDFHCVEENTEIYTTVGWVKAKDIDRNIHRVYHPGTVAGSLSHSSPQDVWSAAGAELVSVHGDLHDELVSKQHSIYLDGRRQPVSEFVGTKLNQTRFMNSWGGACNSVLSDDHIRLLIWAICDAHMFKRCGTQKINGVRWKLSKPRKIAALTELLERMKIPYKVNACPKTGLNKLQPQFIIVYGEWQDWLFNKIGFAKSWPTLLMDCDKRQASIIYDTLAITDGCIKDKHLVWTTTDLAGANIVCDMFRRCGIACKTTSYKRISNFNSTKATITMTAYPQVYDRRHVKVTDTGETGTVVGITTLTGTLITRRNGKAQVTGNCKRLAYKTGEEYDYIVDMVKVKEDPAYVKARKGIKMVSFQKSYGAGIKKVSETTGIPRKEVKAIFEAEDRMYSGVVTYNELVHAEVMASSRPTDKHSFLGYPIRRGQQLSVTGRRYTFWEDDAPQFMRDKGEMVSFSPTKLKNFSIQGGATGDIVPLALGMLVRRFNTDPILIDKALLINTIHDSVMVDCHDSVKEYAGQVLKEVMEDVRAEMKKQWGLDFDLPLNVDVEGGKSWGSMKTIA
jgi:DNA polymerase I-like protein with 3'-5' exonuclease and polymerase domains